jgi:hypothetical protein
MTTLIDRLRSRREMNRRNRAIAHALRGTRSRSVRDELLEMTSRY